MLNYMGSIARREMNHLRLYCMAEVTNIEILEISKIHENLICLDKMSVIILVIICVQYHSNDQTTLPIAI